MLADEVSGKTEVAEAAGCHEDISSMKRVHERKLVCCGGVYARLCRDSVRHAQNASQPNDPPSRRRPASHVRPEAAWNSAESAAAPCGPWCSWWVQRSHVPWGMTFRPAAPKSPAYTPHPGPSVHVHRQLASTEPPSCSLVVTLQEQGPAHATETARRAHTYATRGLVDSTCGTFYSSQDGQFRANDGNSIGEIQDNRGQTYKVRSSHATSRPPAWRLPRAATTTLVRHAGPGHPARGDVETD